MLGQTPVLAAVAIGSYIFLSLQTVEHMVTGRHFNAECGLSHQLGKELAVRSVLLR